MTQSRPAPGAIALVGSGEYLDEMNDTDAYLLETLGGASNVSVALLPTASGLEDGGPTYWNDLGVAHFQQLGVKDIRATSIIDRQSAIDPQQLELLRGVDFYYLSGGNPQHTIETLRDSPALEIMLAAHKRGAILAGCSAGAMALSAYTIALRQMMVGNKPGWVTSLAVVPNVVVFPHFDRMANFIDEVVFQELLSTLPTGIIAVGVDENTALVRVDATAGRWQVMGQQTVKVYQKGMAQLTLHVGEEITFSL
ncbi:MAG: Type 1 glutamine amidotransferase-like domain-containing protein [Ktedonobacteraceae bacterium]